MNMDQVQVDFGFNIDTNEATSDVWVDLPGLTAIGEPKGVMHTKRWVVDLILDLVGYRSSENVAVRYAVEYDLCDL